MPRLSKVAFHNDVKFVTFTVEEDFLLCANPLIRLVLMKCFAQAQSLYPVRVCHFLIADTQVHMLLVVDDPQELPQFVKMVKAESAHVLNRLLGRRKRTIWCEGYDSPTVLDPDKTVEEISYIYANPAQDGLEDSIERYPGWSSWSYFRRGRTEYKTYFIPRDAFRPLPKRLLMHEDYEREARLAKKGKKKNSFVITPDAWMESFGITDKEEQKRWNQRIVERLREREQEVRKSRKFPPIGAKRLTERQIGHPYTPNRTGKRMYALSTDRELRKSYISRIKDLVRAGAQVYQRWLRGELNVPYPAGLFPPAMPRLVEPLGI
jgi:REP element-mobilizing transposase RayT